jgi:hypothetical protein
LTSQSGEQVSALSHLLERINEFPGSVTILEQAIARNPSLQSAMDSSVSRWIQRLERHMARGWESKSVEEQQAERSRPGYAGPRLTLEQAARERQRGGLLLWRKRVERELSSADNPAHRKMLQLSIEELDKKIASLQDPLSGKG